MEFKFAGSAEEALKQIEEKGYAVPFANDSRPLSAERGYMPVREVELVGAGAKELKGYMTRVFERDSFLASLTEAEREMRLGRG